MEEGKDLGCQRAMGEIKGQLAPGEEPKGLPVYENTPSPDDTWPEETIASGSKVLYFHDFAPLHLRATSALVPFRISSGALTSGVLSNSSQARAWELASLPWPSFVHNTLLEFPLFCFNSWRGHC